jgi:hypothetical protein
MAPKKAAPKKAAPKKAAAKKAATPKPPAPKQPQPKSFMARGVGVNKKSQAGDLGSERAVLRQAAQRNRKIRRTDEDRWGDIPASTQRLLRHGLVNVTFRRPDGELRNSVSNRKPGTELGSSNYYILGNSTKNKNKKKK